MTDERLQEIFDSTAADVPDVHLIFGRAVAQAATLAANQARKAEFMAMNAHTTPALEDLIHAVGGTAYGDGSIFFNNAGQFRSAATMAAPPTGTAKP